jgi:HlyD family secretion protein
MAHADVRKRIPIVIVLLGVIGGSIWWFARPHPFLYAGTLEATEITLSARVASVIAAREVREGQDVSAGQTLLTLAGEDLKLAADLAEKEYRRGTRLFADGSLTQASLDQLRFKRDQTALQVEWCTIRAPRAATVLHAYREPGEMVSPGVTLFMLGDLSEVWAFVYVEQTLLARLAIGQEVAGSLPELPGRAFPGRIALIRDEAEFTPKNVQTRDERSRLVYGVKVVFANPDRVLKPGMTIEVKLPEK